ncbi:MAG: ATP-binding protein [Bacteroidales bacterium]|jgi:predicted AAA+ superfamily ATPase|nr:AAA family ATPase [Bacteroidales bacterium]MCK9498779.1 AAA family ATPase [Bacteroidales bacterium]MDY0315430.1 AAA family ATPase [Bacteroidales bacterium]NLB85898.1 ATP-binding protein [Bacteroidales bacterium]
MKRLFLAFYRKLAETDMRFERYLKSQIDWSNRLTAITGARGTGKTTMLLQHIKEQYGNNPEDVLFVSLDNIYFSNNNLYSLADDFYSLGGKELYLDEVHKYSTWAQEIKNIYDDFPKLKIVFTASSILQIFKAGADLSRRVRHFQLFGLSFREFLIFEGLLRKSQMPFSLEEILENHVSISQKLIREITPLPAFQKYLQYGYYPYYQEDVHGYGERVLQTFNTVVESDLPNVESIDFYSIIRIKKLFYILSEMVPFTPNISQLSQMLDVTRTSLMNYLQLLEKSHSILLLKQKATGIRQMLRPEKIYLQNTNYNYALSAENPEIGNLRETFFFNQLQQQHKLTYTKQTDFCVDDKYYFEIGGKNKTTKQIKDLDNAFLALDGITTGFRNEIPLWLFGFLY